MNYVNTVSIVNNECSNFNGGTIVASSYSPGIVDICETPPSSINKGTTYIRVYNDGRTFEK